jgi:hypothetical protein
MAHIDPVGPAGALDRPIVDREGDRVTLGEGYDLGAALHARPLLGEDEFPSSEVPARLRQKHRDLDGKCEVPVEVLVQAIVVARPIAQQQRRRPRLAGGMA